MSTVVTRAGDVAAGAASELAPIAPASTVAFDWIVAVLALGWLGGLFLDGWAHTHGRVDDTFFTPWHAVLYAGYVVFAALLVGRAAWAIERGSPWRAALPPGYGLALAGVAMWVVGGPFDLLWHSVFGFEANVEALLSPAHVVLAVGAGLMSAAPLRAALRRPPRRWSAEVPMALSLTCVVSNLTFFTQIAHPLSNLWAAGRRPVSGAVTELGIVSFLLTALILTAPVLFLLRHGRLPPGAVTIVITLNSVLMGVVFGHGPYPLAAVIALSLGAVAADVLRAALRPAASRPVAFRWFAAALPVLLYLAYFAASRSRRASATRHTCGWASSSSRVSSAGSRRIWCWRHASNGPRSPRERERNAGIPRVVV
jgi:hypothetical protein